MRWGRRGSPEGYHERYDHVSDAHTNNKGTREEKEEEGLDGVVRSQAWEASSHWEEAVSAWRSTAPA